MQKARLLVLDVIGDKGLYESEFECLNDYYKHLKCDCFDIATRRIGNKYFDVFVDDCGLFKDNPIPSVLDREQLPDVIPMLVGNCIFANHDIEGNTTSLTDDDISVIKNEILNICMISKDGEHKDITCVIAGY